MTTLQRNPLIPRMKRPSVAPGALAGLLDVLGKPTARRTFTVSIPFSLTGTIDVAKLGGSAFLRLNQDEGSFISTAVTDVTTGLCAGGCGMSGGACVCEKPVGSFQQGDIVVFDGTTRLPVKFDLDPGSYRFYIHVNTPSGIFTFCSEAVYLHEPVAVPLFLFSRIQTQRGPKRLWVRS